MLNFKIIQDQTTGDKWLETSLRGQALLTIPQLNKGTAFTAQERDGLGLKGKLPAKIETLEEQITRAYQQFCSFDGKLQKNIYLNILQNTNQILFYGLIKRYLAEMIPVIYTPIVSTRVQEYSREFRQPRGVYITPNEIHEIDTLLDNRSNPEIDLIVVTDGERVLGIGDQGVGAMDIPIAKLMIYTLCDAIDPNRTLPIMLDVGTNNQKLLDDPLYLGLRQKRITGKAYDEFIDAFIAAVKRKFPKVFLHWEDFGRDNANRNLIRFRDKLCSFNDDIQGTGVVTLAALLAAVKNTNSTLAEQKIVIFGAGSAGMGITELIYGALVAEGLSPQQARDHFWLVDKSGLLTENSPALTSHQQPYARQLAEIKFWQIQNPQAITLAEVITNVKPTVLIGCSAISGAFTKEIIQTMAAHISHPIIFPISNPTEKAEATAENLVHWTNGKALVATGSPFDDVIYQGLKIKIAQCNNIFAFPGIGLGAISVKAKKVSDNMLWVAAATLSQCTKQYDISSLLPPIEKVAKVAEQVAIAVAKEAVREGLATITDEPVEKLIKDNYWEAFYLPYRGTLDKS